MSILPLWFFLAILTGLTSNAYNFFNRFLLKKNDDGTTYAWYNELIRFAVFAIVAIFDWKLVLTPYSFILFLLFGLTEFVGVYWYMKMHTYSDLSISTILSRTRLIWIPIIAFFVIGEKLKIMDYFGIIIIFFGVSITMAPKKLFIDKGAIYANLAAFVIAINIIIAKLLLPYGSNSVIMASLCIPSLFLFPLLMKNAQVRIKKLFHTRIALKTAAVGLSIIQLYLFIFALRVGDASKINAIYQGMLILSVLAGIIFLKERKNIIRKLLGAFVTIIGVVLLSFS